MMEEICAQFVKRMTDISDVLRKAEKDTVQYWSPDEPPITILFASFGSELIRQFDLINQDTKREVFRYMEEGMNSGNVPLVTAIASGMIEAIVAESECINRWSDVAPYFGEKSLHHAKAWRGDI